MRIITPSGSLSNICNIRGELSQAPGTNSQLEMIVVAVHDKLLECEYSQNQEMLTRTSVSDLMDAQWTRCTPKHTQTHKPTRPGILSFFAVRIT